MKFDYRETTEDLQQRIDIHQKYGARDIDAWMLDLLQLKPGTRILDVACGAGKQCFVFFETLGENSKITGVDVSDELLDKARQLNAKTGNRIAFEKMDFNQPFPYPEGQYDLVSCCFAIYYAQDIPFTIQQMHRVLKPGGRLFTTGPMPENKQLFYDIIREATGKEIPPMPGSSRYASEIYSTVQNQFHSAELHIFENPLTFTEIEPFIAYTRASLSEDRKLWGSFFQDKDDFSRVMDQIATNATQRLERNGKLTMSKIVGGILATK